jgi:hypothetical protein
MKKLAIALALSLVLAFSIGTRAQVASPVADDELAALFSAFCIDAFPVPANLDRVAAARNAVPMTPDEVQSILHNDPGRGWMLRTSALHGITIEYPPYNACAVRRMTPVGVSSVTHYVAAVGTYAAAKKAKLVNAPPQKTQQNGVDISLYGQAMVDASGQSQETFAVILSNYHGQAAGIWRADAGAGVGVEVRFVHQIVKK